MGRELDLEVAKMMGVEILGYGYFFMGSYQYENPKEPFTEEQKKEYFYEPVILRQCMCDIFVETEEDIISWRKQGEAYVTYSREYNNERVFGHHPSCLIPLPHYSTEPAALMETVFWYWRTRAVEKPEMTFEQYAVEVIIELIKFDTFKKTQDAFYAERA